jgi:hypothetical protein
VYTIGPIAGASVAVESLSAVWNGKRAVAGAGGSRIG